jgi:hypothetical protein
VLENVPPEAGLQKRATFSTLNLSLAMTGNQTRATCVAGSGTIPSAIHYAHRNICNKGAKRRLFLTLLNTEKLKLLSFPYFDLETKDFSFSRKNHENTRVFKS